MNLSSAQIELQKNVIALVKNKGFKPAKIANITGRSAGTISDLINGKKVMSERLIAIISEKLKHYIEVKENTLVEGVSQYKYIWNTTNYCHKNPMFALLTGDTGVGKSEVLKKFTQSNKNSWIVRIDKGTSWRELLQTIAGEFGLLEAEGKGKNRIQKREGSAKLLEKIRSFVEVAEELPLLIIDEAEEIPNATLRKLKNLYTATEGLLSIIICGITKTKTRIAKLAGLSSEWLPNGKEQNEYTTFARRLKRYDVPAISFEDIKVFCIANGITNEKTHNYAFKKWWNYELANHIVSTANKMGLNLNTISEKAFNEIY